MGDSREIFTTIIRIKGSQCRVVPVRSTKAIDKSLFIECSKALSRIHVGIPVSMGDVICRNILNTGVDIVCSKNILE